MRRRVLYVLRLVAFAVGCVVVLFAVGGALLRQLGFNLDTGVAGVATLRLPDGYRANVFAEGLAGPRFMAVAPDGTLLVAELGRDRIVALPDADRDGRADRALVVGEGYDRAHSLAFEDARTVLVAGTTTLWRVTLDGLRERRRDVLLSGIPGGGHATRTVVVTRDGRRFLSVGSSCDVCIEADERRAAVLLVGEDGRARVYMRGLRNAVGVAEDPATGRVWVTVNGRDMIGDDQPPETVYELVDGADAGWPRCHAGTLVDPAFGRTPAADGRVGCDGVVAPAATFTAHAAPLGIAFWRDHAVVALHGSWNRSTKSGYRVVRMPWDGAPAGPAEGFAVGWLNEVTGDSVGRPAGVLAAPDGSLYVSDDKAGIVYRIQGP